MAQCFVQTMIRRSTVPTVRRIPSTTFCRDKLKAPRVLNPRREPFAFRRIPFLLYSAFKIYTQDLHEPLLGLRKQTEMSSRNQYHHSNASSDASSTTGPRSSMFTRVRCVHYSSTPHLIDNPIHSIHHHYPHSHAYSGVPSLSSTS